MPCTAVLKVCLDERDRKTQQSQPSDDVLTIGRKRCRFPAQKEQQFRVIKPSVRLRGDTATIWKRSIAPEENTIARTVFDYDFRGNFVRIISEDLANPSPHIERLRNMEENLQMAGSKNTDIVAAESFPNDSTNNYDQSLFRDDYRGHSEQSGATKSPGTTSENSNSFQDNQDMALSRLSGGANTDHSVNDTSSPFNGMSRDSETSPEGDGLPEIPGPHKQHELPVTFLRKPENEPDRDNEAYGSTWPDKKVRQLPNFSNDILADRNANRFAGHTSTAPLAAPAGQMSEPSLLSSSSDIHTVGDSIPVKRIFTVKEPPLRYGSDDEAVDKYSVMERKVVNSPLVEVANRPGKNSVRYYKSDGILYPYHADEPEPIFRPKEVVYGTEDSLLEPSSVRNNDYPRNNGHFIEVYC